jgi:hypothetical protein
MEGAVVARKSSRRLSEQQRDERRRQDRERLHQAAEQLLSSEGWTRWVKTRAMFHAYSAGNCMLLAAQCHKRGIAPTRIAGFHTWRRLGRSVRKGEASLRILAPVTLKNHQDDAQDEQADRKRVFFKTAFVFDVSQTDPIDGLPPVDLEPPSEPLSGDSHAHLLAPLEAFTRSLGYAVSFEAIDGSAGGWCDSTAKRIVIDARAPANARLRTLIHETAHALGIDYDQYSRAVAEVMADTVTILAASSVGLRVDGESVPYVAGSGEAGALEAVIEFAETIDRVARRIENVLLAATPAVEVLAA